MIIIGAGAAGLAAAKILLENGRRVLIVEARDRIGGRILTRHDASIPIEFGPEFIHGRPDVTLNLVHEAGLTAIDVAPGHVQKRRGRWVELVNMSGEMKSVMGGMSRLKRDISFAQYLKDHRQGGAAARQLAVNFVQGFDAADLERISSLSIAEEQEGIGDVGSETQYRLLGGYGMLVQYLVKRLHQRGVRIRLRTPVTEVDWSPSKVTLNRSKALQARRVIITLPLGVLQVLPEAAGFVRFSPDISHNRKAANQLADGPIVKAILRFKRAFWEDTRLLRDAAFWHAQAAPFPTWWTQQPLRVPILTAWAGGPKARALGGLTQRRLLTIAVDSLATLLNVRNERVRRLLEAFHCYDWASDPWSRGAYSYVTVGGMGARRRLAEPVGNTLFFAGEATDSTGQAGTVAGALLSGQRAARQVLTSLAKS